jgi:hypothetical protein
MSDIQQHPIEILFDKVEWTEVRTSETQDPAVDLISPSTALRMIKYLPFVTHVGYLTVQGVPLKVYRLSDGRRVMDAQDLNAFFTKKVEVGDECNEDVKEM